MPVLGHLVFRKQRAASETSGATRSGDAALGVDVGVREQGGSRFDRWHPRRHLDTVAARWGCGCKFSVETFTARSSYGAARAIRRLDLDPAIEADTDNRCTQLDRVAQNEHRSEREKHCGR